MIGKLKGVVDSVEEEALILDVNGVGYLVSASARTLRAIPAVGAPAELLIETYVRSYNSKREWLAGDAVATRALPEAKRDRIEGEPTREKLVKALETMKDFDTGVLFPVTFTATNHEGSSQTKIIVVDKSLTWKLRP